MENKLKKKKYQIKKVQNLILGIRESYEKSTKLHKSVNLTLCKCYTNLQITWPHGDILVRSNQSADLQV